MTSTGFGEEAYYQDEDGRLHVALIGLSTPSRKWTRLTKDEYLAVLDSRQTHMQQGREFFRKARKIG